MTTLKIGIIALALISATAVNAQDKVKGDKAFTKLDGNADGLISKAEFITFKGDKTNKKGEPKNFEKQFAKKDLNGDGNIDRPEFDKALAAKAENKSKKDLDKVFVKMDQNKDSSINLEEFTAKKKDKVNKKGEPIDWTKKIQQN